MVGDDFSGRDVVKALTRNGFHVVSRTGSHVKLRYEHPTNDADVRVVSVPMHDRVDTGTLRSIAEQAGARDFEAFHEWVESSL